jgi:hypothetical protein
MIPDLDTPLVSPNFAQVCQPRDGHEREGEIVPETEPATLILNSSFVELFTESRTLS